MTKSLLYLLCVHYRKYGWLLSHEKNGMKKKTEEVVYKQKEQLSHSWRACLVVWFGLLSGDCYLFTFIHQLPPLQLLYLRDFRYTQLTHMKCLLVLYSFSRMKTGENYLLFVHVRMLERKRESLKISYVSHNRVFVKIDELTSLPCIHYT